MKYEIHYKYIDESGNENSDRLGIFPGTQEEMNAEIERIRAGLTGYHEHFSKNASLWLEPCEGQG